MRIIAFTCLLLCYYSPIQTQSSSLDSLSKEASAFRKTIRAGNLPLVLSEEEKAWMDEILFYEQDSTERAERAAEIERAKAAKEKGSGNSKDSNPTYAVGAIPLEQGVSPSGARTYSIPIPTAPGFKLVPSVALAYNSQAGEGWAGYGWDIQGISTISLINQNEYYHGCIRAASDTTTSPVFALDGVPLVTNDDPATSAAYPLVTATGHILARKVLNPVGYVCKFEVLYPNGCRAVFGRNTYFSSHMAFYRIAEMEDMLGNRIVFTYTNPDSSGNDRISSIRYGFDSYGNHTGEIVFSYTYTSGATQRFFAGKTIKYDYRLTGIESRSGAELLTSYFLSYIQQDNVWLLSQIDCESSSGDSLPPISFTYGDVPPNQYLKKDANGITITAPGFNANTEVNYKRGKFITNEFRDGVLLYSKSDPYTVTGWTGNGEYFYGNYYPDDDRVLLIPRLESNSTFNDLITTEYQLQTVEAVDVDGDGTDEIVKVYLDITKNTEEGTCFCIKVHKWQSDNTISTPHDYFVRLKGIIKHNSPNSTYKGPYHRGLFWGDFNGDGKTELLAIAYNKNMPAPYGVSQTCYAAVIDIGAHTVLSDEFLFDLPLDRASCIIVNDIDGDGKSELCYANDSGFDIYRLLSSGHFALEQHLSVPNSSFFTGNNTLVFPTDINGDGYVDFVKAPSIGTTDSWLAYRFNGDAFSTTWFDITSRQSGDKFMFIDINRDGLADLVSVSGTTLRTYINMNGTSFGNAQLSPSSISNTKGIVLANVAAYNSMSAFIKFDGLTVYNYSYSPVSPKLRLVKRVSDGSGKCYSNDYVYHPSVSGTWTDATYSPSVSDGYAKRALPLYVLSSENSYESSSQAAFLFLLHRYYDPVVHNLGLGFCGFHKHHVQHIHYFQVGNAIRSATKGNETTIFDPEKRGVTTSISSASGSGSTPFRTVTNTWDNHSTVYGKLSPRLTKTVVADSLHGTTATTRYTYDSYDFTTSIKTTRRLGSSTSTNKSETLARTYSHSNTPSRYLLGGVTEESLIKEQDGNGDWSWTQKTAWTLDTLFRPIERRDSVGKHGIIDVPIDDPSLPFPIYDRVPVDSVQLVRTTRWAYDSFGNVSSEKSAPYDATEFLGDTLIYDAAGRFLLSKTDALGHTTSYSGYNKFGSPASVTDYRGRAKTFSYDSWGNLLQTGYADGSVETISREWTDGSWSCGSGDSVGRSVYAVSTTCTGKPSRIVHFDALGREVHSGNKRFDWYWQWTDRQYDLDGRLSKVSLPYRTTTSTASSPSASLWNTYAYDDYDRITSIAEASGRTTTWSYSGTSTTTVKDGISATSTTDAAGNVISVADAGGTISYTLRDDGQPASVTAPGNVVTTFSYDGYGRRVGMDDPSVGERSYSYTWNADGSSQTTQSGPNGTITTSKDKYGRTTSVARTGEFTTTYSYDTYGRLTGETSTNGTSTTYTYDTLDRVSSLREDVPDGKWLKRDYSYGAGSNVSHVQYSSQGGLIAVEHYTYVNGHHIRTELQNGTLVFNVASENDFGQPTGVPTQGVSRQYGFNAYGLPTQRSISVTGGNLQDFNYSFNAATGNLTSRFDSENGTEESFWYDSMNRLTSFSAYNSSTGTSYGGYGYASNGNLSSLSPVGTVLYQDTASPYLATALVPASGGGAVPLPKQAVNYNAYDRPVSISQNGITATLTYNGAEDRVKMVVVDSTAAVPATLLTRYYIGGRYEVDVEPGTGGSGTTTTERFYLGGDAYSAPMVYVKGVGGANYWQAYNIGRDFLGSITLITTASGTPVAEYSYEPWGRMRNPETLAVYSTGNEPSLFLSRG